MATERERAIDTYLWALQYARLARQTVGEKNDLYITLNQLHEYLHAQQAEVSDGD